VTMMTGRSEVMIRPVWVAERRGILPAATRGRETARRFL